MTKKKKMLVVCHDAGGAEIVSAYIKGHPDVHDYKVYVGGPARDVCASKGIDATSVSGNAYQWSNAFEDKKIDVVLTSADWMSMMTLDVLRAAKEKGIHTISYLDHWVCYRERFGYPKGGWEGNIPDELWASDIHSLRLAKKLFPDTKIRLERNLYFKEIKKNFQKYLAKTNKDKPGETLLFISEPVSAVATVLGDTTRAPMDEHKILDRLLCVLADEKYRHKIRIRFHPSEKLDKYDDILAQYDKQLAIEKSIGRSIYEDIAKSHIVIGMESMAMVVALLCGVRVISLLPDCSLPFREIWKVGDIKKIRRYMI